MNSTDLRTEHDLVPENYYDRGIARNALQRFWHQRRIQHLKSILPKKINTLIDVGSNAGTLTDAGLNGVYPRLVVGVDISFPSLRYGQGVRSRFRWVAGDGEQLPIASGVSDCVLCLEMLEHVLEPRRVIKELHRILKPGGRAIVLVPNGTALFHFIWFFWTRFGTGRVWKAVHIQQFSPSRLFKMCQEGRFVIESQRLFLLGMLVSITVRK